MTTTTSEVVIDKLKQHIARHGIPDTIISDNGPQYSSEKFRKFTSKYGISHQTSSPGNSQSNGAAEAAVKTIKRMMRKCLQSKEDAQMRKCPNNAQVQRVKYRVHKLLFS